MQKKFKTWDTVQWYEVALNMRLDNGVVVEDSHATTLPEDCVWVKWESNGRIEYIEEEELALITPIKEPTKENNLSVQSCIDFLVLQGYSVTITKK